jgi:DNA replication protein DnaC
MSIPELERALRALRLSGMTATLQARALQVANREMDFVEAFSWPVQDELDRRRSRLLDRRFTLSGLPERKDLKDFDWSYNPKVPKRNVLELATLKFIEERDGAPFIGPPGVGKSHVAKAVAHSAVQRGYKLFYRETHVLMKEFNEVRECRISRFGPTRFPSIGPTLSESPAAPFGGIITRLSSLPQASGL